jgi:hypothetical protein
LYVPPGYNFDNFYRAIQGFGDLMNHNKYANNHDYYSALLMLKQVKFLSNNMLIVKEDHAIATPVAVLNYSYYDSLEALKQELASNKSQIQCIVGSVEGITGMVPFGKAQQPDVWDYADGVDTMEFLLGLNQMTHSRPS